MIKKILIILSCILATILVFMICWVTVQSIQLFNKITTNEFYSTWMGEIKEDTKLKNIVIPGSHDAGSYGMMPQARTQGHDIIDQLKSGARYFDLRVL